jgi:hypothetical protein
MIPMSKHNNGWTRIVLVQLWTWFHMNETRGFALLIEKSKALVKRYTYPSIDM